MLDLKEIECEDVDWIHLAHERDQWRVLVDNVMGVVFRKISDIFFPSWQTDSKNLLISMELVCKLHRKHRKQQKE
jgi:hypothetical protein